MGENDIILVQDETEANLLETILKEEDIPFFLKEYKDPPFQGIHTYMDSWGHVDAPKEYRQRIKSILEGMRKGRIRGA
jgi:hypothetical protein